MSLRDSTIEVPAGRISSGVDAALLIGQIGDALAAGLSAYELAQCADQHPTAAEGIGRAARALVG
ncbi:hypothetical protein MSM1_13385 [Mycobacterium sp. SM1]|uniref:hypothetical protein n=1 Tax=Mycobacterium sp. SM1 TaxID=2816243 RepID=UPI001BCF098F|nr:hypothetical protein [Mycobacterium sp. SM1]MBS4729284.1 hypothetical protein [Mycobacterium sp. SM1]